MELLKFIFHSFWTFLGTAIILSIFFDGVRDIILAIKNKKNDDIEKIND